MRHSARSSNPVRSSGFTMIELLLVAAITAMVGLAVISVFSAGLRAYHRVQKADKNKLDAYLFFERLERDLRNASNFSEIPFEGGAEKLSFAGWISGNRGFGRVSYESVPANRTLLLKEDPYIPREKGSSRDLTFTGFQRLTFSYGDAARPDSIWAKEFTALAGLPKAVRVELVFESSGISVRWVRILPVPSVGYPK